MDILYQKIKYSQSMDIEYQKVKYSQNALVVSSVVLGKMSLKNCMILYKESCRLIHITDLTYLDYQRILRL